MGIKGFLGPTKEKIVLFIVLAMLTWYFLTWAWMMFNTDVIAVIFAILSYPYVVASFRYVPYVFPHMLIPFVAEAIYLYIIACIYATAYSRLDNALRSKYPQINARWEQRGKKTEKYLK